MTYTTPALHTTAACPDSQHQSFQPCSFASALCLIHNLTLPQDGLVVCSGASRFQQRRPGFPRAVPWVKDLHKSLRCKVRPSMSTHASMLALLYMFRWPHGFAHAPTGIHLSIYRPGLTISHGASPSWQKRELLNKPAVVALPIAFDDVEQSLIGYECLQ